MKNTSYGITQTPDRIAKLCKYILQCVIGVGIILFTVIKVVIYIVLEDKVQCLLLQSLLDIPFLRVISGGLLASTAIELGYMLFTPGPDEAIEPVITGVAAFILLIMSETFEFVHAICVLVLVVSLIALFWLKKRYNIEKATEPLCIKVSCKNSPFRVYPLICNELDRFLKSCCYDYYSTNPEIAEVDENGLITPHKNGKVVLLLTIKNTEIIYKIELSVKGRFS